MPHLHAASLPRSSPDGGSACRDLEERKGEIRQEKETAGEKRREKARSDDIITCLWGPGVDREEGFIRSTVDSALRTLIGYATVCSCIWWLMSTQNWTVLNIYLLVLLG